MKATTRNRRRRIVMAVTAGESGGAQAHVVALSEALRHDHDIHVVTGSEGYLTDEADRLDIPVTVLSELSREISPSSDARVTRQLVGLFRSARPDLVHCHSSKIGALGRLAAGFTGTPSVFTAHGWAFKPNVPFAQRGPAFLSEFAIGRTVPNQRVIAVSETDRLQAIRAHVCRPRQIRTIHNGVADTEARSVHRVDSADIVTVARLAPPKDHHTLLQAFADLPVRSRLTIIGDGPLRAELEARAGDLGLRDRVRFTGDRTDVDVLLANADLFVLSSKKEGLPLSILEAMRAGLAVVASDVGGVRECVRNGSTGLTVPAEDVGALHAALAGLLDDPDRRATWGREGRRLYEQMFRAERMVDQTRQVYDSLTGRFTPTDKPLAVPEPNVAEAPAGR